MGVWEHILLLSQFWVCLKDLYSFKPLKVWGQLQQQASPKVPRGTMQDFQLNWEIRVGLYLFVVLHLEYDLGVCSRRGDGLGNKGRGGEAGMSILSQRKNLHLLVLMVSSREITVRPERKEKILYSWVAISSNNLQLLPVQQPLFPV